jgi:hypothetical protein
VFAPPSPESSITPPAEPALVEHEVERLTAWSGGGDVAVLVADGAGRIVSVGAEHERLGLMAHDLVGLPLAQVLAVVERADGRTGYLLDVVTSGDRTVRTLVLSELPPARGVEGSVVRSVQLRHGDGWVLLVAEDRLYDLARRGDEVPVRLSAPRPRP